MNLLPKSWCVLNTGLKQIQPVVDYLNSTYGTNYSGLAEGEYYGVLRDDRTWNDEDPTIFGEVLTIEKFKELSKEITKGDLIEVSNNKKDWSKVSFHSYDKELSFPYIVRHLIGPDLFGTVSSYIHARPIPPLKYELDLVWDDTIHRFQAPSKQEVVTLAKEALFPTITTWLGDNVKLA